MPSTGDRQELCTSWGRKAEAQIKMTMPGFVFHFRCDSCDATSHDYSVFAFNDILRPDVVLPAWSLTHRCWATIRADLSSGQRRSMASDRDALLSFATSLSSDNLTVGVPELAVSSTESFDVAVTPEPRCPYCGLRCESPFGYPPRELPPDFAPATAAEFRAAPLSLIDLSVRARMIAHDLDIMTVGQLEAARPQFNAHPKATKTTMAEIQDLLSRKPADGP